jgi:C-terminal processing protease CtpA/Prc
VEIYDKIKENYWEKISDDKLSNIYLLAVDKLTGGSHALKSRDRSGVEILIEEVLKEIKDDKKVEFSASLGDLVLSNLEPFGRSRLYAQKDEKALSDVVNNINPGTDRLADLGINKDASDVEVKAAFEKKSKEATTAAEKEKVAQAYEVLKDGESREIYEESGVEPTIEYKVISPSVFWAHLTKFSPTTLEEFARITAKVDKGEVLDSLILDLRGNIGGAIDGLPYFLGPFVGPETLGYQFYRQGEKENYFTKSGWMDSLVRYKKVVILIDENTQSTAEVMAAALKKYNVGILMGTTSKGWGTVERVFPLTQQIADDQKFSLFLVHRVTLRDDGQPIEGRGVEPVISIKNKNWQKELLQRYNFPELVRAVEEVYK